MADGKRLVISEDDLPPSPPAGGAAPASGATPPGLGVPTAAVTQPGAPAQGGLPSVEGLRPSPLQLGQMGAKAQGPNLNSTLVAMSIAGLVATFPAWALFRAVYSSST